MSYIQTCKISLSLTLHSQKPLYFKVYKNWAARICRIISGSKRIDLKTYISYYFVPLFCWLFWPCKMHCSSFKSFAILLESAIPCLLASCAWQDRKFSTLSYRWSPDLKSQLATILYLLQEENDGVWGSTLIFQRIRDFLII